MIAFAVARAKRILLISFPLPVTRETLQRLGVERSAVIRREGAMDMIVDFSASPPVVIPSRLTHEHVAKPSPVPGFRRVCVAPRDELFGSLRRDARGVRTECRLRVMAGRKSSLAPAAP